MKTMALSNVRPFHCLFLASATLLVVAMHAGCGAAPGEEASTDSTAELDHSPAEVKQMRASKEIVEILENELRAGQASDGGSGGTPHEGRSDGVKQQHLQ